VRYKKPVGVYWLQAAVVETASALGCHGRRFASALPRAVLIGAIGAVLLTYWTALAFVTRRGAILAALILCSSVFSRRSAAAKPMRCCCRPSSPRWGRWRGCIVGNGARIPRTRHGHGLRFSGPRGRRHPARGPLILMFVGLTIVTLAILDRSAAWLWRLRPVWGLMWTLVLVLPWFVAIFWRAGDAFFAD
jgi:4-amino-4-deoxy-L-arabinose transferase-like glycosyltransferase